VYSALYCERRQVWAEGTVPEIEGRGRRWWYGVLESRAAIHAVLPGDPAPAEAQA
jgi:hypothetical protein